MGVEYGHAFVLNPVTATPLAATPEPADRFALREHAGGPYGGSPNFGRIDRRPATGLHPPPRSGLHPPPRSGLNPPPQPGLHPPPQPGRFPSVGGAAGGAGAELSVRRADAMALAVRVALDRVAVPLALAASAFARASGWRDFGYARGDDHARERYGRSGRWLRDLAALGAALTRLPRLGAALTGDDGGRPLGKVAALLIGTVADPDSLPAWIDVARRLTVRELRAEVARARASPAGAAPPLDEDRIPVRIPVPSPVLVAFDEGVDLFRAIEGRVVGATSFVEALVAETLASGRAAVVTVDDPPEGVAPGIGPGHPLTPGPEVSLGPAPGPGPGLHPDPALSLGPAPGPIETALSRSTDRWRHLPPPDPVRTRAEALGPARDALRRLERLAAAPGEGSVIELDARLRRLVALEDELEAHLGDLLACLAQSGGWARLRFAGVGHYSEERLGLSRTAGEDRARAARALRRFPLLRARYHAGRVGLESALLVDRILREARAGPRLERLWVERASSMTVKRLRDEARLLGLRRRRAPWTDTDGRLGTTPGTLAATSPGAPLATSPGAPPATSPGTVPAPPPGTPPSDAEWQASLRRPPGLARARVHACGRAALGAFEGAVDPAGAAPPSPDVFLRLRLPVQLAGDFLAAIESNRRFLEARAGAITSGDPGQEPAPPPSMVAARTFSIRRRQVPPWVGLLAMLEDFVDTWDPAAGRARPPSREAVFIRDGWRCTAPGCSSRRHLEDHHLRYRSHGGGDQTSNRATLCRFHHQQGEHGGLASCAGRAPLGVVWRLGRAGMGGRYLNERRLPQSLTWPRGYPTICRDLEGDA